MPGIGVCVSVNKRGASRRLSCAYFTRRSLIAARQAARVPTQLGAAPQVFFSACLNDAGTHNAWWNAEKQKANPEELALVLGVVAILFSSEIAFQNTGRNWES